MDINIPAEAVEAAAQQVHARFASYTFIEQQNAREAASTALNAAAPLIVAAVYEQLAREFKAEYDELTEDVDVVRDPAALELYDKAKKFRARAKELRGAL